MDPKEGTKVEAEQQFSSYGQRHVLPFNAPLYAITFTNVLFPAMKSIGS
jgi:hypothetical protein